MVTLSDLEMDEIRKVIMVDINGNLQAVTIKNLTGEKRDLYISQMKEEFENEKNSKEEINEKFFTKLFIECTDLIIDRDIMPLLDNPTGGMIKVMNEIIEILHELQCQMMLTQLMQLNIIEESLYTQLILLKTNSIEEIAKETDGYKKKLEKNEVLNNRALRKEKIEEQKREADKEEQEMEEAQSKEVGE